VFLTTRCVVGAVQLCCRVAVRRGGSSAALSKPQDLAGVRSPNGIRCRRNGQEVVLETHEPTKKLHELTAEALAHDEELEDLQVRRPTLEEVYLDLTGGEPE